VYLQVKKTSTHVVRGTKASRGTIMRVMIPRENTVIT
jgi:hypothetical protein